jgi:ribonucleotide monophosphatase NagD (HAD superfamily)
MVMARNAGMSGVLVLTGATSLSDLAAAEASVLPDYVIQTLPQLLAGVPTRHDAASPREKRNLERA